MNKKNKFNPCLVELVSLLTIADRYKIKTLKIYEDLSEKYTALLNETDIEIETQRNLLLYLKSLVEIYSIEGEPNTENENTENEKIIKMIN